MTKEDLGLFFTFEDLNLCFCCYLCMGFQVCTTRSVVWRDGWRSLGTRPFAGGGRVWALSYIQVVPRMECWPGQSESLIANDVMEMVLLQAFGVANDYVQQIAVLLRVSPKYLRRAINRSAGSVCVVSPQIANYPCVIAFHRDNSNVGTCPDPSGSISTVWRPEVYITEHARFTVWSHRSTSLEYDRGLLTLTQKFPLIFCGDHIPT